MEKQMQTQLEMETKMKVSQVKDNDSNKNIIVFLTVDMFGHINPIIPIAKHLVLERNFRCVILTLRRFKHAHQFTRFGIEHAFCEDQIAKTFEPEFLKHYSLGARASFESTYGDNGALAKHLDDMIARHDSLEAKLRSLEPDLVVLDYIISVPCATYVAKKWVRIYSAFPVVQFSAVNDNFVSSLGLSLHEMTPEMKLLELKCKRNMRQRVREFCLAKGLPDWPNEIEMAPSSPHLNICFGPDELSYDREPSINHLDPTWLRLEHTIDPDEPVEESELPVELIDKYDKVIYFSLGTLVSADYGLINKILEMLSKLTQVLIIVSMGPNHERVKLYPNMWGRGLVEQKAALRHCDIFITHGGHNSIIEAFYFGVPGIIVMPIFADQFDNAQRVHDCGFGVRINPYECKQHELISAIESLFSNKEVAQKMQTIGLRLRSLKYHLMAADKLEQLVNS